jgi:hypothetical protein
VEVLPFLLPGGLSLGTREFVLYGHGGGAQLVGQEHDGVPTESLQRDDNLNLHVRECAPTRAVACKMRGRWPKPCLCH